MMQETRADDMPCRPLDQTTAPDCAASCPLMPVCTANCLPSVHAASGPVFGLKGVLIRPGVDVLFAPLSHQPPPRPPRPFHQPPRSEALLLAHQFIIPF